MGWLRNVGQGLLVLGRAVLGTAVPIARQAVHVAAPVGVAVLEAMAASEADPGRRLVIKAAAGVLQERVERERAAADAERAAALRVQEGAESSVRDD